MPDLSKLSLEKLQQRLVELETEWYEIEAAIAEKHEEGKVKLAEEIKQQIEGVGHDVADIVRLLTPRKRSGKASMDRSYAKYVDPDNSNNTYVRGVLPGWMKDKMRVAGYDPGNKEDRETFKSKYLKKVS